jgi:hypothetical protein
LNKESVAEGIVGRKKNNDEFDLYETPSWATELIMNRLIKDSVLEKGEEILEPCSGAGAISKVLEEKFKVKSSDIQNENFIYGDKGIDVYKMKDKSANIILTNPPYNMMTKKNMLNEFLRISKNKVILLLNIYYLSSKDRKEMLEKSPLKYIYIHSDRVTMFPFGEEKPKSTGTKMFAWFVWEHGYDGEPIIRWVSK